MQTLSNYIAGQQRAPLTAQYLDSVNPATGRAHAQVPASGAADVQQAIASAQAAFPAWSALQPEARAQWLWKIAQGIEDRAEQLAQAESDDNGKPISLARQVDIPRAARNFRFFASAIEHWASESHARTGFINYTLRQPLGVGVCISPWNLPLYLLSWKIAPALAAGNTVVAKPSEVTPLTAFLLGQICEEIGLPAGVLNLVHGRGQDLGESLCSAPEVKAVSFTGSTRTGEIIARSAAPRFKKISLEMGGKNAGLIFADCDYDRMLDTVLRSGFANQGQICLCTSRLLVEKSIYARFCDDLVARVQALKQGDPQMPETQQGAVVSLEHQAKILRYLKLARDSGAEILCGGEAVQLSGRCADGYFVAPTVITGLGPEHPCNREEIFGPVVTVQSFESDDEALALANASDYGLACSIWTQKMSRAQSLSRQIQAGIVWVNCWMERDLRTPFGGVKASGVGREGGWEALRFWTEPKNVCIADA